MQSRAFVPVVSTSGLHSGSARGDVSLLHEGSGCDNVVLEYRLALELHSRRLIESVLPVLADPGVSADRAADVMVRSVDDKVPRGAGVRLQWLFGSSR